VTGVRTGFEVVLIAEGINVAINHALMAATGKEYNLIGNLTNGALQWYNKNIGSALVKTGNPLQSLLLVLAMVLFKWLEEWVSSAYMTREKQL